MNKFLVILLFFSCLNAYSFGKNKFETKNYRWKVLETEHFKIFYYKGGEFLSKFAAGVLENVYSEYTGYFNFQPGDRIPVIIYNSPKEFQETNVTPGLIEEGVGGFTEIFKNRVVVPFAGSYREFRHVLRHELTHVFQYYLIKHGMRVSITSNPLYTIPLWVMEGMAEYFSLGWDQGAESYIRDLVLSGNILSIQELNNAGGYIVYKEGQLIYRYMDIKYGKKSIGKFFSLLVYRKNFDDAIRETFGMDVETFNANFMKWVKEQYYPVLSVYQLPSEDEGMVVSHKKWKDYINTYPVFLPDGGRLAVISNKYGRTDLFLVTLNGKIIKRLIKGELTPDFESLHVLRPGLDVQDSTFVIATQTGSGDVLQIFNLNTGKRISKVHARLDAVYSPKFSPEGKRIAFVGIKNGQSDIYLYKRHSNAFLRMTSDFYDDRDPVWFNDSTIIYVSDYNKNTDFRYGKYALFFLDLNDSSRSRITPYFNYIANPCVINDTLIAFISSFKGSRNIFVYNLISHSFSELTFFASEVVNFNYNRERNLLAYTLLNEDGYDIFQTSPDFSSLKGVNLGTDSAFYSYRTVEYTSLFNYSKDFSVDYVHGFMTYSYPGGFGGLGYISLSDELGNNRIDIISDLYGNIVNSDFEVDYSYLAKRIDQYFSFYQWWDYYYINDYDIVGSRNLGFTYTSSYPTSKFLRFEFGLSLERHQKYLFTNSYSYYASTWHSYFTGLYGGIAFDNVLYNYYGDPKSGTRAYTGGVQSFPVGDEQLGIGLLDYRYYAGITKRSIFAFRTQAGISYGKDKVYFELGGPYSLRGYYDYQFYGSRYFLTNLELRVPVIDILKMSFPLPLTIGGIRGILFFDMGNCWNEGQKIEPFGKFPELKDIHADIGAGLRLNIGIGYLRFDTARRTNLVSIDRENIYQISIGQDF